MLDDSPVLDIPTLEYLLEVRNYRLQETKCFLLPSFLTWSCTKMGGGGGTRKVRGNIKGKTRGAGRGISGRGASGEAWENIHLSWRPPHDQPAELAGPGLKNCLPSELLLDEWMNRWGILLNRVQDWSSCQHLYHQTDGVRATRLRIKFSDQIWSLITDHCSKQ